jgi:Fe-S-cluster containining protein
MKSSTEAVAMAEVRTIYRDLEARPVERACRRVAECCHFKLTGKTPFLTAGEALLAATALRATGRTRLAANTGGVCPLFDQREARCLIYEARPFGCRTHFCAAAGGPYARAEVIDLIRRLEDVDRRLGGGGARPLPAMIEEGLRKVGSRRP